VPGEEGNLWTLTAIGWLGNYVERVQQLWRHRIRPEQFRNMDLVDDSEDLFFLP